MYSGGQYCSKHRCGNSEFFLFLSLETYLAVLPATTHTQTGKCSSIVPSGGYFRLHSRIHLSTKASWTLAIFRRCIFSKCRCFILRTRASAGLKGVLSTRSALYCDSGDSGFCSGDMVVVEMWTVPVGCAGDVGYM